MISFEQINKWTKIQKNIKLHPEPKVRRGDYCWMLQGERYFHLLSMTLHKALCHASLQYTAGLQNLTGKYQKPGILLFFVLIVNIMIKYIMYIAKVLIVAALYFSKLLKMKKPK